MFWLLAFVVVGGSYAAMERFAVGVIVAVLVSFFVLTPLLWFSGVIGTDAFIVDSWQFLSGVDTPNDVVWECSAGQVRNFWILAALPVAIFNVVPGFAAIIGLPVGIAVTIAGALWFGIGKGPEVFKEGLLFLTIGTGGLVLAGLVMRLLVFLTGTVACSYW